MPKYWKEKGDNPYDLGERKETKGINLQGKQMREERLKRKGINV